MVVVIILSITRQIIQQLMKIIIGETKCESTFYVNFGDNLHIQEQ